MNSVIKNYLRYHFLLVIVVISACSIFFSLFGMEQKDAVPLASLARALQISHLESNNIAQGLANYFNKSKTEKLVSHITLLRAAETKDEQRQQALECLQCLGVSTTNPRDLSLIFMGLFHQHGVMSDDPVYKLIIDTVNHVLHGQEMTVNHDLDGQEMIGNTDNPDGDQTRSVTLCGFMDNKVTPCLSSTQKCVITLVGLVTAIGGLAAILGCTLPSKNEANQFILSSSDSF